MVIKRVVLRKLLLLPSTFAVNFRSDVAYGDVRVRLRAFNMLNRSQFYNIVGKPDREPTIMLRPNLFLAVSPISEFGTLS